MDIKLDESIVKNCQTNGNGKKGQYISLGSVKKGTENYDFIMELKAALSKKNIPLHTYVMQILKAASQ